MKLSVVVFVICVISTTVSTSEDHHRLKEKSHNAKSQHSSDRHHHNTYVRNHNNVHHSRNGLQYRSNGNNTNRICKWVCGGEIKVGLEVLFNSSGSLLAVVNVYGNVALAFDYRHNIVALINGQTGVSYILNISTQQLLRLPNIPGVSWDVTKSTFQEYFGTLCIQNLLKIALEKNEILDRSKLPSSVNKDIEELLKRLGLPLGYKGGLELITNFISTLNSTLLPLYLGNGVFPVDNTLKWFFNINSVIASLASSGIDLSKVKLDPRQIFDAPNGIESILNFFSQINRRVDCSSFIKTLVTSREKALEFLSKVGSGSNNGLDGLITILVKVVKVVLWQESVTEVIVAITRYNSTGLEEPTWGRVVNRALEIAKAQVQTFPYSEYGVRFIKFLEAINHNNLVINNVHIFDLLKILFTPNPLDRIKTIINVLSCFLPHKGIPAFFNFIREALNNTGSVPILNELLPNLDISKFINNGSALENILQGRNLTQLLSSSPNVTSVLSNIPVFGPIAKRITSSLGVDNLEKFLNPSHLLDIFNNGGSGILGSLTNSTSTGGIGGIVNSIQKDIGGLFGLGNGLFNSVTNSPSNDQATSSSIDDSPQPSPVDLTNVVQSIPGLFGNLGVIGNIGVTDRKGETS